MQTYYLNNQDNDLANELESESHLISRPSRLNGENIAGAALIFFASLFIAAGQVNAVFAVLYPADFLIIGFGVGLLILGYRTWRNENRKSSLRGDIHGHY